MSASPKRLTRVSPGCATLFTAPPTTWPSPGVCATRVVDHETSATTTIATASTRSRRRHDETASNPTAIEAGTISSTR